MAIGLSSIPANEVRMSFRKNPKKYTSYVYKND